MPHALIPSPISEEYTDWETEVDRLTTSGALLRSRSYRSVASVYGANTLGKAVNGSPNNPLTNGNCWGGGDGCYPMLDEDATFVDANGGPQARLSPWVEDTVNAWEYVSSTSMRAPGDLTGQFSVGDNFQVLNGTTGSVDNSDVFATAVTYDVPSNYTTLQFGSVSSGALTSTGQIRLFTARPAPVFPESYFHSPVYDPAVDAARLYQFNDLASGMCYLATGGGWSSSGINSNEFWYQIAVRISPERFFNPNLSSTTGKFARVSREDDDDDVNGGFTDFRFVDMRYSYNASEYVINPWSAYNDMSGCSGSNFFTITSANANKWYVLTCGATFSQLTFKVYDEAADALVWDITQSGEFNIRSAQLPFTSGGPYVPDGDSDPGDADFLTDPVTGATAQIVGVVLQTGSWAAGTAEGFLWVNNIVGTFQAGTMNIAANTDVLTISGPPPTPTARNMTKGVIFHFQSTSHRPDPSEPDHPEIWLRNGIWATQEILSPGA